MSHWLVGGWIGSTDRFGGLFVGEFGSESDTADSEATGDNKTWSLITSDEKMNDRVFKYLEKHCDSVFNLVSEKGR